MATAEGKNKPEAGKEEAEKLKCAKLGGVASDVASRAACLVSVATVVIVVVCGRCFGSDGAEAALFIKGFADVTFGARTALLEAPRGAEAFSFIGEAFQAAATVFLTLAGFSKVGCALAGVDAAELSRRAVVVRGASVGVYAATVGHTELVRQAVRGCVFALGCANVLVAVAVGAALGV